MNSLKEQFVIVRVTGFKSSSQIKRNLINDFGDLFGAFADLRKATITFVMPVRLADRMEHLGYHWTDFHNIDI